ncbi:MAG: OmpA family protein [Pseudomonadota bacterium]
MSARLLFCVLPFLLAGCGTPELDALRETRAVGNPFSTQLANEYRMLGNGLKRSLFDAPDADHFARKGMIAASGENVMPEPINDWHVKASQIEPFRVARGRLIRAFDLGGREIAATDTAKAQVAFDCWLEQQEDKYINPTPPCRAQFATHMTNAESKLTSMPVPPMPPMDLYEGVAADPSAPMDPSLAKYLVFFDFDKTALATDSNAILDAVADEIRSQRLAGVVIVGHADRAGSEAYNDRLSQKRAAAVRQGLESRGVPADLISTQSRGENDPMVATRDNIREPANRRAEITFR